ncbi:MAG: Gfo/Idh/MocA family oxidoreductase [Verrucomicrobia bacterium]|nr:Gfo/Idh/MocA family oxidoreductase [Cytophagales bacterium]
MMNRRNFLKNSTLTGVGLFTAPYLFSFKGSPNEKVVLAVMGTNSRGMYLANIFAKMPNVEIGYICDVDENVLNKSIAEIEKSTGKKPKGFKDLRKLLEIKDFDGLVVAAPDHWHAPAVLMGVQAGKHVYVEKPCSHNPAEGEILVKAAQKYKKLIQMGNQRRSFPGVQQAIKALHEGIIGRVYFAKGWYANDRKSIGFGKVATPPTHLDFDLWQGPAPRRSYKDNLVHYNWHWFWHYGTGEALNNGTHEIDVMRWGLGVDFPTKVISAGGRYHWKDDWETPDTQTVTYEFANNTAFTWESRSCNNYAIEASGRGVVFYGEKGTMVIPGGDDYKIFEGNKLVKEMKSPLGQIEATTVGMGERLDSLHLKNFIESVQEKTKLTSPIAEGHISTLLPQLGNIAFRTGETLYCDTTNGKPKDKDALKLWSREYEKGWEMKL